MKKLVMILPIVMVLCLTFACQQGEEATAEPAVDVEAEKQIIRDMLKKGFEIEQQKDIDALIRLGLFAEDVIVQPPNMPQLKGLDALRAFYTEYFKVLISSEGEPIEIFISEAGDMAWDYGWNRTILEGPEGPIEDEGKYLEVWNKIDGKWKIVAVSYSSTQPAS